ncbi:MAG: PKD domain-containing protein, partial [Thermoplasmata archaeon]|nr:PKD domain-containing protein [Thermoplasmata archaeon]
NLSVLGPTSVLVGSTLNATVSVSGGAPGVSYQWSGLPDGCSPPGSAQLTCQPTAAGTYNITVTAVDGGGGVSTITYQVSVVYPTATTGTSAAGLPTLYLVGVLMAAVIVVVAVVASRRRPPQ